MSSAPVLAQQTYIAAPALPAPMMDDPLTVSNVVIDKTDKNAVVARDSAIMEAKRTAFQQLAARNLPPEALKDFKPPSDQVISRLVRDFEITNEQLSATRYVANFTVRFQAGVSKYMSVKQAAAPVAASASSPAAPAGRAAAGGVLVLPYYENVAGKLLLWEDGNPWMAAWKSAPPDAGDVKVAVPLGDIGDLGAGDAAAVWSGDYGPVEKLRANYGADEVVLVTANKSGPRFTLDLYTYSDGRFDHDPAFPIQAAVSDGDAAVYRSGMQQVLSFLKNRGVPPKEEAEDSAVALPVATADDVQESPAVSTPALTPVPMAVSMEDRRPGPVSIDAEMNFDSFARWVEAQKRLSSVMPPVKLEIRAISSSSAAFTLDFAGNLATLKSALAQKNIALAMPVVEVDEAVLGGTKTTQRAVYELQLVN